ncbi:hypothetical protein FNH09_23475 [Streptomyces adustus]|uniref:Uncharacterized protein n=1 Tax=Streptomyces adustus TaxID=1609272 RepID=A0A5N8VGA3_9ACTN|nr:hypothetical protein [Streptomyces adustus]MPY34099.1 hypothetical protein [Streptomyces adustus]
MSGVFGQAADWLEFGRPSGGEPLCVHHGPACELGTVELPEIYRMVVEARQRLGMTVPPLDEHRVATPAEAAEYRREFDAALAEAQARNAAVEAELRGEPL